MSKDYWDSSQKVKCMYPNCKKTAIKHYMGKHFIHYHTCKEHYRYDKK